MRVTKCYMPVLMLNTDLYNSAIMKKMTEDQFIHNLRGQEIGKRFLVDIYKSVAAREIKMKDDHEYTGGRPAGIRSSTTQLYELSQLTGQSLFSGTSWRPAVIKLLTEGAAAVQRAAVLRSAASSSSRIRRCKPFRPFRCGKSECDGGHEQRHQAG